MCVEDRSGKEEKVSRDYSEKTFEKPAFSNGQQRLPGRKGVPKSNPE